MSEDRYCTVHGVGNVSFSAPDKEYTREPGCKCSILDPVLPVDKLEILSSERTIRLVIECPAKCKERGCTDEHGDSGWRRSLELKPDMSIVNALKVMEAHAARYPNSGPYRLTRYVETTEETRQVLS